MTDIFMEIRGVEFLLQYSMRALLMYEKFSGQSFNSKNLEDLWLPKTLEDLCKLFYCCVVTSEGASELEITYDEFIDYLRLTPYEDLSQFANFLNRMIEEGDKFLSGEEEDDEE